MTAQEGSATLPCPMVETSAMAAPGVEIRSLERAVEVAWFSALCADDYEYLGVPDPSLGSTYEHCGEIVRRADALGYGNILLPSAWIPGQDALTFAAAMAVQTRQINQLVALRMGEVWPPMLARAIATVDHMAKGRLAINIISSDLPGKREDHEVRYARSREVIQILKEISKREGPLEWKGRFYDFVLPDCSPGRPFQGNGGPMLYFGGISPMAQALCAEFCDVFLMWPETEGRLLETMRGMTALAAGHGRQIDFGLRVHVIVRETEAGARAAAGRLISRLDRDVGRAIKERSQDCKSLGVLRQDDLRAKAGSDLYIEEHLWAGIGLARSGCGSAIVGDPDQVVAKLNRYIDMGIRAFILSGYPHLAECELFARHVLPRLPACRLNAIQGRVPHVGRG